MATSQVDPSTDAAAEVQEQSAARLSYRQAFYHLVNVEEHPEILPLAKALVEQRLQAASTTALGLDPQSQGQADAEQRLTSVLESLSTRAARFPRPWRHADAALTRGQLLHYLVQYLPTALVDGCWLQGGLRVASAHTNLGAALTGLYQHQVRGFVADPGRHFTADYRSLCERLAGPLEEVSSHSFARRADLREQSLALPLFLLAIAQYPRTFTAEILGVNLAWQFLDLCAFAPELIRDAAQAYGLPPMSGDLNDAEYLETGRAMARRAALGFLEAGGEAGLAERWNGLLRGIGVGVAIWQEWFDQAAAAAPQAPPDPRREMIDLLWRKAPHGRGYHGQRSLGPKRIDDYLDTEHFDPQGFLEALGESPWVRKSKSSGKCPLLGQLIELGGPMLGVFTPVEQEIIRSWVDALPTSTTAESAGAPRQVEDELYLEGRSGSPAQFRQRSQRLYGKAGLRELYHALVNVEFHPEILPLAERFAQDRLERSMAMLWKGERPIPARRYSPEALESWVYQKHREQVDSYRPPGQRPQVAKAAFIESTLQLAPLILLDGGWLQGIASPAIIHTEVGRLLFHVFAEEIGEGEPQHHHANIYRDLLRAMGEDPPPVDSLEFAQWPRLDDASFEVPTLWLAISCFPRHFLPEILGLNLAVELAGVGGPYMEARDALRQFGYPSLFVDMHNAADNVTAGHTAWALDAVKRYLDEVAQRDGPHNVDRVWQRVWAGVRATLPQIGRVRMTAHRIQRRLFAQAPTTLPLIFPS